MKRPVMLFAALIFILMNFGGCRSEDDGSGGNFFAVIGENPKNLDPQLAQDSSSLLVIKNIYATLTEIDGEGNAVSGAAESFEISEDGRVYTFTLRPGLVWRGLSGEDVPLTAHDYEYAFKRIYTPGTCSPHTEIFSCIRGAMDYYEGTALDFGVYALDNYRLQIELSKPDCDFIRRLAHPAASPCNEKLFLETRGRYGLSAEDTFCCGAFYVADWNYDPYWTENRIILERIGANSREGYRTFPRSVHIEISGDRAGAELKNNSVTEGYAIDSRDGYTKEVSRNYDLNEYYCGTSFLMFAPGSVIGENEQARRALRAGISREGLSESLGQGRRADGVFPEGIITGGKSIREICSDEEYGKLFGLSSPRALWDGFKAETDGVDFNSLFLLISDDYPSPGTAEAVIGDFERELEFYCTPVYEAAGEYSRRVSAGEYDLRIETVCPSFGLASDFAELLTERAGNSDGVLDEKAAAVSGGENIREKALSAGNFEEAFISGGYAVPISYEAKYFLTHEDTEDIWYDPFTEVIFYKYAKKFGD